MRYEYYSKVDKFNGFVESLGKSWYSGKIDVGGEWAVGGISVS